MAVDIVQFQADPIAIDLGNKQIQGRVVSKTQQMSLFTANYNAVWIGHQVLRREAYPFATVTFPANRNLFKYQVGDVFKWSYAKYGIVDMVLRVLAIEEDNVESNKILVHTMEDIYSVARVISDYSDPSEHTPVQPTFDVLPFVDDAIVEPPYAMTTDVVVLPMAARVTNHDEGFDVYISMDGGTSYVLVGTTGNILAYGELVDTYPVTYAIDEETGFTAEFDFVVDLQDVESSTWANVLSGVANTAMLGSEIISFLSITPVSGTQYLFEGIVRGRYGTKIEEHAAGTPFYIVPLSTATLAHSEIIPGASRKFKFVPFNFENIGDIADSNVLDLAVTGKARTPYEPINFDANGRSFAARYEDDVVLTWSPRKRGDGAGIGVPGTVLSDSDHEGLFKIEVYVSDVLVRTVNGVDAQTWTYTLAMNVADNGSLAPYVEFKLYNYRIDAGVTYESSPVEVTCKFVAGGAS
jgi:hypothetical protein